MWDEYTECVVDDVENNDCNLLNEHLDEGWAVAEVIVLDENTVKFIFGRNTASAVSMAEARRLATNRFSRKDMKGFADWCRCGLLNVEYAVEGLDKLLDRWIEMTKHKNKKE